MMDSAEQAYKATCRDFFLQRYKVRVASAQLRAHPIPDNAVDNVLPFLLNDKQFYQGRIYASSTAMNKGSFSIGVLLWEALGMVPNDFMVACDTMSNAHSSFSAIYQHREFPAHLTDNQASQGLSFYDLTSYFNTWHPMERDIAYTMVYGVLHTYRHTLQRANLGELWVLKPSATNNIYPLEYGLMVFIEEQWSGLAWVYLDNALLAMPGLPEPRDTESTFASRIKEDKIHDHDEKKETARAVHVLFSAAGTGKTRQIFELLRQHWGFYMMAPNLEPTQALSTDVDIIEPRRYFTSRDTYTMYEDHPQISENWKSTAIHVFVPLIVSRVALLYEFIRRHPEATPTKWLWLQISCKAFDPFDALYRLFRLVDPDYLGFEAGISIQAEMPGYVVPKCHALLEDISPQSSDVSLYYCFDEAQYTLETPEALSMLSDLYNTLTLFFTMSLDSEPGYFKHSGERDSTETTPREINSASDTASCSTSDDIPIINSTLVVSGTSLQIEKLEETLDSLSIYTWGEGEIPVTKWDSYLVHNEFPLITSYMDFWKLYEKHLTEIISESKMIRNLQGINLPLLSRSGRPLAFGQTVEEIDLDAMRKWLWKPLEIPPVPDILSLLNRAHVLRPKYSPRMLAVRQDFSRMDLETLLDHHDSETIASVLISQLVLPFHQSVNPQLGSFGASVLRLLALYSGLRNDELATKIREEASRHPASGRCFQEVADMLHDIFRNLFIRNIISTHSLSQRGRYRWSTIYIEEIMFLAHSQAFRDSSLENVKLALEGGRNTTYHAAVTALKSQIRKMRASGKTELAQDLFRAGIRAEVMSMPSIFLKKSNAELVTYGFALVQRDGETIRYTLAEPIAIYAVMDYLRTEGGSEYQELMLQWLINTQEDYEVQAMFGKATEWFIAMSLDYILRPRPSSVSGIPDLLNGSARRETLLSLLAESLTFNRETDQLSNLRLTIDVDNFTLSESSNVFKYDSPGTIWSWMKQYRVEGQTSTPTFMFPDINSGPDLLFILERNKDRQHLSTQNMRKIFVAVQIKTGTGARFENAMETLIEDNWHRNLDKGTRDAESAELEHWHNTPFILLLICTAITVKQGKIIKWLKKNAGRIPKGRFVCVLDETVTSSIWGHDFVALADAIKRQRTQQKEESSHYDDKRGTSGAITGTSLTDRSRKRARAD